jgi:hypothetical protein
MTFFSSMRGVSVMMLTLTLVGCAGRAELLPNSDKTLRKTSAQFAADAAKRSYKADAPRGGTAEARAQVGYMVKRIEIENLSDADWSDVEVWVNKKYVVFVPLMEKGVLKALPFQMLFDDAGNSFPLPLHVDTVEIFRDGKMYDVTTKLAD